MTEFSGSIGQVEALHRPAFGCLTPPVIPGSRRAVGMPSELLKGEDIDPVIEQVRDRRPSHIVR